MAQNKNIFHFLHSNTNIITRWEKSSWAQLNDVSYSKVQKMLKFTFSAPIQQQYSYSQAY